MHYNTSIIKTLKSNPRGVKITNSSAYNNYNVEVLLDFWSDGVWISGTILNQSFTIDFGDKIACVERYALRLYPIDHYPISWSVYGSFDGLNWSLIDHRDHDICASFVTKRKGDSITICGIYAVEMFEASNPMCYRFIKVQQDGQNSGSKYNQDAANSFHNAFYLNGFEVFGSVRYLHDRTIMNCRQRNIAFFFLALLITYVNKE